MEENPLSSADKKYLVLDTNVLEFTQEWPSNYERAEQIWSAIELLARIYKVCHRIVIDDEGQILEEYGRHMESDLVKKWFTSVSSLSAKITSRPRARVFSDLNIDPDDLKFLEVAANSPHRIIITSDSDFLTIRDNADIRRRGIRILTIEEALQEL